VDGKRLILWLFLVLAVCTVVVLLYLAAEAPPSARPRVYLALVGNLLMAALALLLIQRIGKRRAHLDQGPDPE
jgi:hypothetical protein